VNLHVSTRGHWTLEWPGLPAMHCPSQHQQTTGNDQMPATRTAMRVHPDPSGTTNAVASATSIETATAAPSLRTLYRLTAPYRLHSDRRGRD
jgi:hypothetical protein